MERQLIIVVDPDFMAKAWSQVGGEWHSTSLEGTDSVFDLIRRWGEGLERPGDWPVSPEGPDHDIQGP